MRFCKYCGNQVNSLHKYCWYCGEKYFVQSKKKRRCEICNEKIFFGKLCNYCKQTSLYNIKYAPLSQKIFMDNFAKENMLISYYADIIEGYLLSLENLYRDLEYNQQYKNMIEPNNFKGALKIYKDKLNRKLYGIKVNKIKLLEDTGEVKYFTAIVGLEEDIKDTIKSHPYFQDILKYDDLEKIIEQNK